MPGGRPPGSKNKKTLEREQREADERIEVELQQLERETAARERRAELIARVLAIEPVEAQLAALQDELSLVSTNEDLRARADARRDAREQEAAAAAAAAAAGEGAPQFLRTQQLRGRARKLHELATKFRADEHVTFEEADALHEQREAIMAAMERGDFVDDSGEKLGPHLAPGARVTGIMRKWMLTYRDFLIKELQAQMAARGRYDCYADLQWFIEPPDSFILGMHSLDPLLHFLPRVLVVNPDEIWREFAGRTSARAWSCQKRVVNDKEEEVDCGGKLKRNGWAVWRFYQSLPCPSAVLSFDYQCTACGQHVGAMTDEFLGSSPELRLLRDELPCTLTHKSGLARQLADVQDICPKLAFADMEKLARSSQALDYDRKRALLGKLRIHFMSNCVPESLRPRFIDTLEPKDLPHIDHPAALVNSVADVDYFVETFLSRHRAVEIDYHQAFSMLSATSIAADGAFKFPRRILQVTCGICHILVIVNEDGLVRYLRLGSTKSQEDFRDELAKLQASLARNGYPPIECVYVDDMHHLGPLWAEHGGEAMAGRAYPPLSAELEARLEAMLAHFKDVERAAVSVTSDPASVERADAAIAHLREQNADLYGVDLEWDEKRPGVDVVTVGCLSYSVIFHIARTTVPPDSLRAFLTDASIAKIGFNFGGDNTRLLKTWGFVVANISDLRAEFRARFPQQVGGSSLRICVDTVLAIEMVKERVLTCAYWPSFPPHYWQIYCHADVLLMLMAKQALDDGTAGGLPLPAAGVDAGTHVRLHFLVGGNMPDAYCEVLEDGNRLGAGEQKKVRLESKLVGEARQLRLKTPAIELRRNRCHVRVLRVHNGDAKVPGWAGWTLRQCGDEPFSLLVERSKLRMHRGEVGHRPPLEPAPGASSAGESPAAPPTAPRPRAPRFGRDVDPDPDVDMRDGEADGDEDVEIAEVARIAATMELSEGTGPPPDEADDLEAASQRPPTDATAPTPTASTRRRTRANMWDATLDRMPFDHVREDAPHIAMALGASTRCDLFGRFVVEYHYALYTPYADDFAKVDFSLREHGSSAEDLRRSDRNEFASLVRCVIEEPATMWPRVQAVLEKWIDATDAQGVRLFPEAVIERDWPRDLESLRTGAVSDIPGHAVHVQVGFHKKYRVPIWKRVRGTSRVERFNLECNSQSGGFCHRPEVAHFKVLRLGNSWNLRNVWWNRGSRGHNEVVVMNEVDDVFQTNWATTAYNPRFVNGRLFARTNERHGLGPLTEQHCKLFGIERGPPKLPASHSQFNLTRLLGTTAPIRGPGTDVAVQDAVLNTLEGMRDPSHAEQIAFSAAGNRVRHERLLDWVSAKRRLHNPRWVTLALLEYNREVGRQNDAAPGSYPFMVPNMLASFLAACVKALRARRRAREILGGATRLVSNTTEDEPASRTLGGQQPQGARECEPLRPMLGPPQGKGKRKHAAAAEAARKKQDKFVNSGTVDVSGGVDARHCWICSWLWLRKRDNGVADPRNECGGFYRPGNCEGAAARGTCPWRGEATRLSRNGPEDEGNIMQSSHARNKKWRAMINRRWKKQSAATGS